MVVGDKIGHDGLVIRVWNVHIWGVREMCSEDSWDKNIIGFYSAVMDHSII